MPLRFKIHCLQPKTKIEKKYSRRYCDGGLHWWVTLLPNEDWRNWERRKFKDMTYRFCPYHQERSFLNAYLRDLRKKKVVKGRKNSRRVGDLLRLSERRAMENQVQEVSHPH